MNLPTGREAYQTGEPWHHLSCHGGKTPAKPHVVRAAPRPVARYGVQGVTPCQTREPRGLLPSGGNFTDMLLSHEQPRAQRARCGVQGYYPYREPLS